MRVCWLEINGHIKSSLLSKGIEYDIYQIYKLNPGATGLKQPYHQTATIEFKGEKTETNVNLDSETLEAYTGGSGGWSQIKLGSFHNKGSGRVHAKLLGSEGQNWKKGLTVARMEFRQVPGTGVDPGRANGTIFSCCYPLSRSSK